MFRASPVTYRDHRDHRRWPRGTTEGGQRPREIMWANWGWEPAPRWAGAPPTQPMAQEEGKGGNPSAGGPKAHQGCATPLLPRWPPHQPPSRAAAPQESETLKGAQPRPPPLYSGHFWPLEIRLLPLSRRSPALLPPPLCPCLAKPCRETSSLHRHHVVVLPEIFPNLSLLLAGSRCRRRHRTARVLNAEVSWFGTRSESHRDLNRREYDSINRVLATLPLSDLQRYEDALTPLSLLVSP